jgi:hypothetical protein
MQVTSRARNGQRGQALTETALILPLFLLVLFGVLWGVQASVVGERTQVAVRFSGLVSNQTSPYLGYSLYALYNGLPGSANAPNISDCAAPNSDALLNNGQFVGPITQPFWQPISGSTVGQCHRAVTVLTGGSIVQPVVFIQTLSQITSQVSVQGVLQSVLTSASTLGAQQNFFVTPDVARVLSCYPEVGTAAAQSLNHTALLVSSPPGVLSSPGTNPLAVNLTC